MIPLINPQLPDWNKVSRFLEPSRSSGKLTNFGPCYYRLTGKLHSLTGRHCVPCANGTAAIQLIAQVAFPRGSRVLMPDYTHVGTLQGLVAAGMTPILVPASRIAWTANVAQILAIPEADYDAIMVVSPFGYRVSFDLYDQIAKEKGKPIAYDLAGGFGMNISTTAPVSFSMHATKNLPVGEGGIACFTEPHDQARAVQLSCFDQNIDRSINSPFGNNLKLDEVRCAIALAHLDDYDSILARIQRKRELIDLYQEELGKDCIAHSQHTGNAAPSLCVVGGLPAEELEAMREMLGFEVKAYYPLLSEMEGLQSIARPRGKSSPFFRTCAALPSDVSRDQARSIARAIKRAVKAKDARVRRSQTKSNPVS